MRVRVTPRGGADRLEGVETETEGLPLLRLRVRAAPADGEANAAVIRLLADLLDIARGRVRITAGGGARIKTIEIDGLDETEMLSRILA